MQTFLSEFTFSGAAEVLDKKRLQKQLLEGRQILDILLDKPEARWRNHPAVLMWKGYEYYLYLYCKRMMEECVEQGINVEKNALQLHRHIVTIMSRGLSEEPPVWWVDGELQERIVVTHRARLYVKKPEHYPQYEQWVGKAETMRCCSHCNYFWYPHHVKNLNNLQQNQKI